VLAGPVLLGECWVLVRAACRALAAMCRWLSCASLTWACPVVTQARKWLSRSWAWCSSGCGSGAVTALLSGWVPPGPIGLRSLVGELVRGGAVAAEAWGWG